MDTAFIDRFIESHPVLGLLAVLAISILGFLMLVAVLYCTHLWCDRHVIRTDMQKTLLPYGALIPVYVPLESSQSSSRASDV